MGLTYELVKETNQLVNKIAELKCPDYNGLLLKHKLQLTLLEGEQNQRSEDIKKKKLSEYSVIKNEEQRVIRELDERIDKINEYAHELSIYYPREKLDLSRYKKGTTYFDSYEMDNIIDTISKEGLLDWILMKTTKVSKKDLAISGYIRVEDELNRLNDEKSLKQKEFASQISNIDKKYANEQKKSEQEYQNKLENEKNAYNQQLNLLKEEYQKEKRDFEQSSFFASLAEKTKKVLLESGADSQSWGNYEQVSKAAEEIAIGSILYPCYILNPDEEQKALLEKVPNYDASKNGFTIPYTVPTDYAMCIRGERDRSSGKLIDTYNSILLRQLRFMPVKSTQMIIVDTFSRGSSLGKNIRLTIEGDGCGVIKSVVDKQGLSEVFDKLTESIHDIQITLASSGCKSVHEYNQKSENEQIPYTFLVVHSIIDEFDDDSYSKLSTILHLAEQCGITVLLSGLPKGSSIEDCIVISENENNCYLTDNNIRYLFMPMKVNPDDQFYTDYNLAYNPPPAPIEYLYFKHFDASGLPAYTRGKKKVFSLPYAIDKVTRQMTTLVINDTSSFASFIMGGSGSGKSTTLDTIIFDIITQYHPDDAEIWLAVFDGLGFSNYLNPIPPHVKYIVRNKTLEVVRDFFKTIEKEADRRQRILSDNNVESIFQLPDHIYMPVIFVVIDEFAGLSTLVSGTRYEEECKNAITNMMKLYRKLGFRPIFACQDFSTGNGLFTVGSKNELNNRISLYHKDPQEIRDTLGLKNLSEEQINWVNALSASDPNSKNKDSIQKKTVDEKGKDRDVICYSQNLYLGDDGTDDTIIRQLAETMSPVDVSEYSIGNDPDVYVDKNPQVFNGDVYVAYDHAQVMHWIESYKKKNIEEAMLFGDEIILVSGTPNSMSQAEFLILQRENDQNLFIYADDIKEWITATAVTSTLLKEAAEQGLKTRIWTRPKNRLYHTDESVFNEYDCITDSYMMADMIAEFKEKVASGEDINEFVVLVGMSKLLENFENGIFFTDSTRKADIPMAETDEELLAVESTNQMQREFEKEYDIDALEEQWMDEGLDMDRILAKENELWKKFLQKKGFSPEAEEFSETDNTYHISMSDFRSDFQYVLQRGGLYGLHFIWVETNYNSFKEQMNYSNLKRFTHKCVFKTDRETYENILGVSLS